MTVKKDNPYVEPNPFIQSSYTKWGFSDELVEALTKRPAKAFPLPVRCAWDNCKRALTHHQLTPWNDSGACTLHALWANEHQRGSAYTLMENCEPPTDKDRQLLEELTCCGNCGEFFREGGCTKCHFCADCMQHYAHFHCAGCQHPYNGEIRCPTCLQSTCCVHICDICYNLGQTYCRECCQLRPKEFRHPPPPPNVHMNQGMYVEGHDWKTYPARRPAIPPYKPFLYLGVELEMECGRKQRELVAKRILEDHKWDLLIKHDGSLKNGLECVTGPMSLDEHQKFWPIIVPALLKAGGRAWEYTTPGLHVHCSRDWFTNLTIGKMLVFLNSPRTKEFHVRLAGRDIWWGGPGNTTTFVNKRLADGFPPYHWQARFGRHFNERRGIEYYRLAAGHAWYSIKGNMDALCQFLLGNRTRLDGKVLAEINVPDLLQRGLLRKVRVGNFATGYNRYEALNLANKDTIEFRLFKSTLKIDHILAEVEYCHALSNWAQDASLRDAENWAAFWLWVNAHPRRYPHLITFFEHPRTQRNDARVESKLAEEVS